jgi:hypothetical protein
MTRLIFQIILIKNETSLGKKYSISFHVGPTFQAESHTYPRSIARHRHWVKLNNAVIVIPLRKFQSDSGEKNNWMEAFNALTDLVDIDIYKKSFQILPSRPPPPHRLEKGWHKLGVGGGGGEPEIKYELWKTVFLLLSLLGTVFV